MNTVTQWWQNVIASFHNVSVWWATLSMNEKGLWIGFSCVLAFGVWGLAATVGPSAYARKYKRMQKRRARQAKQHAQRPAVTSQPRQQPPTTRFVGPGTQRMPRATVPRVAPVSPATDTNLMRRAADTASHATSGPLTRDRWRAAYVHAHTQKPLSPAQQQIADAVAAARATVNRAAKQPPSTPDAQKPAKPKYSAADIAAAAAAARHLAAKQARATLQPDVPKVRDSPLAQAQLITPEMIREIASDQGTPHLPQPEPDEDERATKLLILQQLVSNFFKEASKAKLEPPACIRGLGAMLVDTSGELAGYHKVPTDLPVEDGCWTSQVPSDSAGRLEVYVMDESTWAVLGSSLENGKPKGWTIRADRAFPAAAELQFTQVFDFLAGCASQWFEPRIW